MIKALKIAFGLGTTILFLWLIFKKIDLNELTNIFREVDLARVLVAIVFFFVGYVCRIERWRLMLLHGNKELKWLDCAGPLMASVAANNVLPLRAGDILRAVGFNKRLGVSASLSVTTLLVERLLDLLMLIAFLGAALIFFEIDAIKVIGIGGWVLLLVGCIIGFFLMRPEFFQVIIFRAIIQISKFSSKAGMYLDSGFSKAFNSLKYISNAGVMLKLVLWSFAAWLAEGFVFLIIATAIPQISNVMASWLALPVGTLSTIIPSTPGYVGTFDYFTALSMSVGGNTYDSSIAYAFIVHSVLWLPPILIGGAYLLLQPILTRSQN